MHPVSEGTAWANFVVAAVTTRIRGVASRLSYRERATLSCMHSRHGPKRYSLIPHFHFALTWEYIRQFPFHKYVYTNNVAFSHHLFSLSIWPDFYLFPVCSPPFPTKTVSLLTIYMLCFLPPLLGIIGPSVISIFLGPPPHFLGLRQQRGGGKGSWASSSSTSPRMHG